jgi:hypothetical protein
MPHDPPHRHIFTCHMPHVTLQLHATCYMLTCHMLHAITLHATCHYATLPHATLHAACHITMPHATCHMPHADIATCHYCHMLHAITPHAIRYMPHCRACHMLATCFHMLLMPHVTYMPHCHVKMLSHATCWRCHVNPPHAHMPSLRHDAFTRHDKPLPLSYRHTP